MTQLTMQRTFDAPAETVWQVMTDPDVYATVAPNLSSVTVLEGSGEGMIRECVDTDGNVWTESCHHWEDGREFAVAVDVETSEFHRPWFTRFDGTWVLEEQPDSVVVTMRFDFDTKYGVFGRLLASYFEYKAGPLMDAIFDGWAAEIETRLADPGPSTDATETPEDRTQTNRLYR